jgi:hypothetical protein
MIYKKLCGNHSTVTPQSILRVENSLYRFANSRPSLPDNDVWASFKGTAFSNFSRNLLCEKALYKLNQVVNIVAYVFSQVKLIGFYVNIILFARSNLLYSSLPISEHTKSSVPYSHPIIPFRMKRN